MPGLHAFTRLAALFAATPRLGMLCVLLVLAAVLDCRTFKIPNWLTGGGLLLGLAGSALFPVQMGIWLSGSLAGAGVGLLLMLPLYALKSTGAGDVKLMAMAGAFLGLPDIWYTALATFITGGVAALAFALYKGALGRMLRQLLHVTQMATFSAVAGIRPTAGTAPYQSAGKIPYGISIAIGTITYILIKQLGYL